MHEIDLMLKHQLEGRHVEARALSDKLEAIGPEKILDPHGNNTQDIWFRHCFNRGWFLLQEGKYQEGSQLLEHGRFLNVYGNPPVNTTAPIYNPQEHDIKGKTILLSMEGGYGDEVIHSRFVSSFKRLGAGKVYLACSPELISVFERIPGVDGVVSRGDVSGVEADFWVPGFSAGWIAGHTFEDLPNDPYLFAKPESIDIWKNIINSDKIKVGIRWAGNPKFEHQQFRRFTETFITNISQYPELQVYSLQRDSNLVDLPPEVVDLQHMLLSWEDTLAAIENLDLIITSCTSVAHVAAAMGKEVWVMVPILPYHTWTYKSPDSTTSPYYKTVRLFRQRTPRKWNEAFQDMYSALEEKYGLQHIDLPNEDKQYKKLNLGCGFKQYEGFVNVDKLSYVEPDEVVDLNVFPWPWADGEFNHIIMEDTIQKLGQTGDDFNKIIKELYRISTNGAVWEISAPHWSSDSQYNDVDNVHVVNPIMLSQYSMQKNIERLRQGVADNLHAYNLDVDVELVDVRPVMVPNPLMKAKEDEEAAVIIAHMRNIVGGFHYLLEVHKAGRYSLEEFEKEFKIIKDKHPRIPLSNIK